MESSPSLSFLEFYYQLFICLFIILWNCSTVNYLSSSPSQKFYIGIFFLEQVRPLKKCWMLIALQTKIKYFNQNVQLHTYLIFVLFFVQISQCSTQWSLTQRKSWVQFLCLTSFAPTKWWPLITFLKTRSASCTLTSPKTRPFWSTTPNLQSVSNTNFPCYGRHPGSKTIVCL